MRPEGDITTDSLAGYHLSLIQPAAGYRFSIDALLLAFFVSEMPGEDAVEIGCGCGVVSLVVSRRTGSMRSIEMFEIQPALARMADENVRRNPVPATRLTVRNEDARFALLRQPVDLVFCNPPFHDPVEGRVSPRPDRALARHTYTLKPDELAETAVRMLKPGGSLAWIVPARKEHQWVDAARRAGLMVSHRLCVHSREEQPPSLILHALSATDGPVKTGSLVIFERDGKYTETARNILGLV